MTQHLHPWKASYPLINTDDTLVIVHRDHIVAGAPPILHVKALNAAEILVKDSQTLDDRSGVVVLDYTAGVGDTLTFIVNGGAPTVLTEGVDFASAISNDETAIQIAAAINTAAIGLTATFETGSPNVFITPNPGTKWWTVGSSDQAAFSTGILATPGSLVTLSANETTEIELPVVGGPTFKVHFVFLYSGRLSVDLRTPVEVRTYLRQPATLSGNTGHPGGWPTSP